MPDLLGPGTLHLTLDTIGKLERPPFVSPEH